MIPWPFLLRQKPIVNAPEFCLQTTCNLTFAELLPVAPVVFVVKLAVFETV